MSIPFAVPFASVCLATVVAAQGQWLPPAPGTPDGPMVLEHAMAPDLQSGVLVFGGHPSNSNYTPSDQLWRFRQGAWTQLTSAHRPPGRRGPMMALDDNRGRVILHGGFLFDDTWEWDGLDWHEVPTVNTPGSRTGAAFCFDSGRGRCVLYGGWLGTTYSDTWEFDGVDWVLREATFPPLQEAPDLAYDRRRGRSVMVAKGVGQTNTWEWDGNGWIYRTTLPVLAPYGGMLAYDEVRARTVYLTAGAWQMPGGGDTWEWDGTAWVLRSQDPALARSLAALSSERGTGTVYLYGGVDTVVSVPQRTIRSFRSEPNVRYEAFGSGCGGAPSLQAIDWPWLGDTMRVRATGLAGSPALLNTGFSTASHQGTPLPFPLGALGFPGCTAYVGPEIVQVSLAAGGHATFTAALPNAPALVGVQFAQQALFLQGNGLSMSAAARATVAMR
jgi:hypothetical protein